MKSNFLVSSETSLTEFCRRIVVVSILLKELELRTHLRKFELYIYLGNTVNPVKQPYLLYVLIPQISIECQQSLLKLF